MQTISVNKIPNGRRQYLCTIAYIVLIVVINATFMYAPHWSIAGSMFSSADIAVGFVYLLRDFSQREIKHYIIPAMLIGCGISYLLADKDVAIASVVAFFVGEFIDWGIYTFTKKPLSQRLLLSSVLSTPIDTLVFLHMVHMLNWAGFIVMSSAKILGALSLWMMWKMRDRKSRLVLQGA